MSTVNRRESSLGKHRDAPYRTLPVPATQFAFVVVENKKDGFRIVPASELEGLVPEDGICSLLDIPPGDSAGYLVRCAPVSFDSTICAYMHEARQSNRGERNLCADFLGEIGLVYASENPTRAVIVQQHTENDSHHLLGPHDLGKLQHLYQSWKRSTERSDAFDLMPEGTEEPDYEPDSLDLSVSGFTEDKDEEEESEPVSM